MGNQGDDRYGGNRWRDRGQGDSFGRDRDYRDHGRERDREHGRQRGWDEGGREASGWGPGLGGDRDRDRDRERSGGDGRGFFERARDEARTWFGGDGERQDRGPVGRRGNGYGDDDRERGGDPGSGGSYGYMSNGWGNQSGESWNRDRPGVRGGWDDETGSGRERERSGERGWFTDSVGGERGNRPGASGPSSQRVSGGPSGMDEEQCSRGAHLHDPHYADWRRRQMEELDRDYEEYRREHQAKFETEFAAWRTQRQGMRQKLGGVTENMEVLGSDGTHVGTVDKVRGDRIVLNRKDPAAGGIHHSIPCSWVEAVEGKVTLNRTAEEAHKEWRNEDHSRALFEREEQGTEGPHMLNRSFSGTYSESDTGRDGEIGRDTERDRDGKG